MLSRILQENCDCGAITVGMWRSERTHTCGEKYESRKYSCGMVLEYSPNFGSIKEKYPCNKSKEAKEKFKKDIEEYETCLKIINQMPEGSRKKIALDRLEKPDDPSSPWKFYDSSPW